MKIFLKSALVVAMFTVLLVASNAANIDNKGDEVDVQHYGDGANGGLETERHVNPPQSLIKLGRARRSCIERGENCDLSTGSCCESLTCRCNLWGTNCRCQRSGIF